MERLVRAEHGESSEDEDETEDDLPGLYYPYTTGLQTWLNFKEHGVLPEPGGWFDQDWRLVECDWLVVGDRYARMHRLLYPMDGQKGGDGIALPEAGTAGNWMDMLK